MTNRICLLNSITQIPELTDNGNVSLFQIGNDVFACGETCYFHNISPGSLKPRERYDASKTFGMEIMSAHPLTDEDGAVYNIGVSFKTGLKYNIVKITPSSTSPVKDSIKKAKVVASIPCSSNTHISYMHSFGLTKNYIICIEQPYGISVSKVLAASMKKHEQCQLDWMDWREGVRNRFILVHKQTGKVIKTDFYSATPFFFFHVINCYEENDQIIIDMPTIKDASFIVAFTLTRVRNGENESDCMPVGKRFVIPIVSDVKNVSENVNLVEVKSTASAIRTGSEIVLTPEILVDEGLESPTINKNYLGRKYNYYYATGSAWKTDFINCVSKVDTKNKKFSNWKENEFCFMEEPLFVPNPKGTTEDDGVLLCVVTDVRDEHEDFLIVLNAKNMEELGRAKFKSNLPHGIHGLFLPAGSS